MIREIVNERRWLEKELPRLRVVKKVHESDANFLLVEVIHSDARELYNFLLRKGIVVRDRSRVELCEGCLRITVGTPEENKALINALAEFEA